MIEAVVFESTYNLVGRGAQARSVSEVHEFFGGEVDDMLYEIQRGLRGHLAVTLLSGLKRGWRRTRPRKTVEDGQPIIFVLGSSPCNAAFYASSTDAAREFPDPSPTHTEYWEFARENGLLAD